MRVSCSISTTEQPDRRSDRLIFSHDRWRDCDTRRSCIGRQDRRVVVDAAFPACHYARGIHQRKDVDRIELSFPCAGRGVERDVDLHMAIVLTSADQLVAVPDLRGIQMSGKDLVGVGDDRGIRTVGTGAGAAQAIAAHANVIEMNPVDVGVLVGLVVPREHRINAVLLKQWRKYSHRLARLIVEARPVPSWESMWSRGVRHMMQLDKRKTTL